MTDTVSAINYIKSHRKLDEDLHKGAPKGSLAYHATEICLKYWDMAIQALEQTQGIKDAIAEIEQIVKEEKPEDSSWACGLKYSIGVIRKHTKIGSNWTECHAPQDDCDTECIYCKHCFEGSEFENATPQLCVCTSDIYPSEISTKPIGYLTEVAVGELRHRFGDEVEFVVRDMLSGKGERWKNGR